MNKLKIWANLPRVLPHIICYALNKQKRMIINKDIMARPQYRNQLKEKNFLTWELCSTLIDEAEFRNLFYMRIGAPRHLLNILLPKISSMRLSPHIGEGFCPIHSYSTIINGAAKIGNNCTIYHCVTIAVEKTAQVRKSVDSPPGMLTEDHHHTVHEERQVCYSSHLRPKSLHL